MTREDVIKGLQEAAAYFRSSFDAMYGTVACEKFRSWTDAIEQAIALLKAQEPVEPVIETHWETPSVYDEDVKVTENKCGACGAEIDKWDKYCRMCGRAVKWE